MAHHGYAPQYVQALASMVTPEALRTLETRFSGGIELKLRPVKASPLDTEPNPKSVFHGHRMQSEGNPRVRNYAPAYAGNLPDAPLTVVELGILRGVGLAIWCDLFTNARVIGLDVDLSHYHENLPNLIARGAFSENRPEVFEYDELAPDAPEKLRAIFGDSKVDVFIDDALHYDTAILKAMRDVMPFMAKGGRYFVEDNFKVHAKIKASYPTLEVQSIAEMTVITC